MSDIMIPEKVRIINKPSKYPITYKDAAGGTVAAAAAVEQDISLFGKTKIAQVENVSLTRGISPKKPVYQLNSGNTAEIQITGPIPANTTAYFKFKIETTNREFRLARPEYEFGQLLTYEVLLQTGDTDLEVLRKLYDVINAGAHRNRKYLVTAKVGSGGTLTATTLDILDIVVEENGMFLEDFSVEGEDDLVSQYVTVFNPTNTEQFLKGKGYGSDVEFREKMQYKNNVPYHFDFEEIPVDDALYTVVSWNIQINRPDPKSPDLSENIRHVVYVKEDATGASAYIDAIADFFLTTPATRATSLAADGIKVSFNDAAALTNTAVASSASNLDSDHGTLTPIFGALAGTDPKFVVAESVVIDDTLEDFMLANFKTNA